MRSKLVVFEGIDGVGKTTLADCLVEHLRASGIKAVKYETLEEKQVGFNQIKDFIKQKVAVEASFLFYLSSAIYKSQKIKELLLEQWVICDRYIYSTLAYHKIRGVDISCVKFRTYAH